MKLSSRILFFMTATAFVVLLLATLAFLILGYTSIRDRSKAQLIALTGLRSRLVEDIISIDPVILREMHLNDSDLGCLIHDTVFFTDGTPVEVQKIPDAPGVYLGQSGQRPAILLMSVIPEGLLGARISPEALDRIFVDRRLGISTSLYLDGQLLSGEGASQGCSPSEGYWTYIERIGDLCLVSEVPLTVALAPLRALLLPIGIIYLLLVPAIFVVGHLISKRIGMAIDSMTEAAEKIRAGSFDVRVDASADDDLRKLASSFNRMARELEDSRRALADHEDALEQQVIMRTRELGRKLAELEKAKLSMLNILEDFDESNRKLLDARKDLQGTVRKLREMDRRKDEFLSVTAHELKTPLTSILGFTNLLKDESVMMDRKLRKRYLDIISEDVLRLERLSTVILDQARLDQGTMKFVTEAVTVEKVISDLRDMTEFIAHKKGLQVSYQIEGRIPVLRTDGQRLLQVLSNLVSNSIKFTKKGSITVRCWNEGKKVFFSVSDTGIGIPRAQHDKMFQRFYQVESAYTRMSGGSGLGLSICKGIVQGLGGKISFQSSSGRGSTFTFYILARKV